MSFPSYLEGVVALALVIGPWCGAGWATARALRATWPATTRALAASIVAIAGIVVTSQAVGSFGQFRRVPLAAASIAAAGVVIVALRRVDNRPPRDGAPADRAGITRSGMALAARVALVAGCLVVAQWSLSSRAAFDHGIIDVDSQSYHLAHAARFVQDHGTTALHQASADEALAYHPANTELLHAVGMLTMRSDVLSVVFNLALLPLGLLAAFCVGRRFGTGPASMVGFAVLAALPLLGVRYAGSGRNDYAAIALFLAAAAFALHLDEDSLPVGAGLAGLAAGLALGTKLTMVVPVAGLCVTVLWLRRRHRADIAAFTGGALATGSYWYIRNLVHVGNPVPTLKLGFLPSPPIRVVEQQKASVVHYFASRQFWADTAPSGMTRFLGVAWPLVLLAVAYALVAWLVGVRRPGVPARGTVFGLAVTAIATIAAYLITPTTGGSFHGRPVLFVINLRYSLPGLIPALVLLPAVPRLRARQGMVAVGGLLLMCIAFASRPHLPPRALVYAAVLVAVVVGSLRVPRAAWRPIAVMGLVGVVLLGFPLTRRYERTRFARATWPTAELLSWGRAVPPGSRVALVGFPLQYAFDGPRFQTRVDYLGDLQPDHEFTDYRTCASWRTALRDGRYDFVVAQPRVQPQLPPAGHWTETLPGARAILRNPAGEVLDIRNTTSWPDC
jgi:hypothetical protein